MQTRAKATTAAVSDDQSLENDARVRNLEEQLQEANKELQKATVPTVVTICELSIEQEVESVKKDLQECNKKILALKREGKTNCTSLSEMTVSDFAILGAAEGNTVQRLYELREFDRSQRGFWSSQWPEDSDVEDISIPAAKYRSDEWIKFSRCRARLSPLAEKVFAEYHEFRFGRMGTPEWHEEMKRTRNHTPPTPQEVFSHRQKLAEICLRVSHQENLVSSEAMDFLYAMINSSPKEQQGYVQYFYDYSFPIHKTSENAKQWLAYPEMNWLLLEPYLGARFEWPPPTIATLLSETSKLQSKIRYLRDFQSEARQQHRAECTKKDNEIQLLTNETQRLRDGRQRLQAEIDRLKARKSVTFVESQSLSLQASGRSDDQVDGSVETVPTFLLKALVVELLGPEPRTGFAREPLLGKPLECDERQQFIRRLNDVKNRASLVNLSDKQQRKSYSTEIRHLVRDILDKVLGHRVLKMTTANNHMAAEMKQLLASNTKLSEFNGYFDSNARGKNIDHLELELKKLQEDLDGSDKERASLLSKCASLKTQLEAQNGMNTGTLLEQLREKDARIATLKNNEVDLKAKLKEVSGARDDVLANNLKLNDWSRDQVQKLQQLTEEKQSLEVKNTEQAERVEDLEETVMGLTAANTKLQADNDAKDARILDLQKRLKDFETIPSSTGSSGAADENFGNGGSKNDYGSDGKDESTEAATIAQCTETGKSTKSVESSEQEDTVDDGFVAGGSGGVDDEMQDNDENPSGDDDDSCVMLSGNDALILQLQADNARLAEQLQEEQNRYSVTLYEKDRHVKMLKGFHRGTMGKRELLKPRTIGRSRSVDRGFVESAVRVTNQHEISTLKTRIFDLKYAYDSLCQKNLQDDMVSKLIFTFHATLLNELERIVDGVGETLKKMILEQFEALVTDMETIIPRTPSPEITNIYSEMLQEYKAKVHENTRLLFRRHFKDIGPSPTQKEAAESNNMVSDIVSGDTSDKPPPRVDCNGKTDQDTVAQQASNLEDKAQDESDSSSEGYHDETFGRDDDDDFEEDNDNTVDKASVEHRSAKDVAAKEVASLPEGDSNEDGDPNEDGGRSRQHHLVEGAGDAAVDQLALAPDLPADTLVALQGLSDQDLVLIQDYAMKQGKYFPLQFHRAASDPALDHILRWMPDGRNIQIVDKNLFFKLARKYGNKTAEAKGFYQSMKNMYGLEMRGCESVAGQDSIEIYHPKGWLVKGELGRALCTMMYDECSSDKNCTGVVAHERWINMLSQAFRHLEGVEAPSRALDAKLVQV